MGAPLIVFAASALLAAACLVTACSQAPESGGTHSKDALPPGATAVPGVLTVAVDPSYPPFAGRAGGRIEGLDVDVVAALADSLGLKVRLVPYERAKLSAMVASPTADVAFGGLSTAQIVAAGARPGGAYAFDGPALFTAKPATLTLDALADRRPGAQDRSEAWWRLRDLYGDKVATFETLRDAFGALADGRIDTLGADALVGGYIARDFPGADPAGVMVVRPVEVAVLGQDPALAEGLRKTVRELETNGVLQTLRAKWAGAAGVAAFEAGTREARVPGASRPATGSAAPATAAP